MTKKKLLNPKVIVLGMSLIFIGILLKTSTVNANAATTSIRTFAVNGIGWTVRANLKDNGMPKEGSLKLDALDFKTNSQRGHASIIIRTPLTISIENNSNSNNSLTGTIEIPLTEIATLNKTAMAPNQWTAVGGEYGYQNATIEDRNVYSYGEDTGDISMYILKNTHFSGTPYSLVVVFNNANIKEKRYITLNYEIECMVGMTVYKNNTSTPIEGENLPINLWFPNDNYIKNIGMTNELNTGILSHTILSDENASTDAIKDYLEYIKEKLKSIEETGIPEIDNKLDSMLANVGTLIENTNLIVENTENIYRYTEFLWEIFTENVNKLSGMTTILQGITNGVEDNKQAELGQELGEAFGKDYEEQIKDQEEFKNTYNELEEKEKELDVLFSDYDNLLSEWEDAVDLRNLEPSNQIVMAFIWEIWDRLGKFQIVLILSMSLGLIGIVIGSLGKARL